MIMARNSQRGSPVESQEQVLARKRAEDSIRFLQNEFREKSLIQLLPIIIRQGGRLAALVAIGRIERNQANKLSLNEQVFLEKTKAELAKEASAHR